jgi:hypothetical protein
MVRLMSDFLPVRLITGIAVAMPHWTRMIAHNRHEVKHMLVHTGQGLVNAAAP